MSSPPLQLVEFAKFNEDTVVVVQLVGGIKPPGQLTNKFLHMYASPYSFIVIKENVIYAKGRSPCRAPPLELDLVDPVDDSIQLFSRIGNRQECSQDCNCANGGSDYERNDICNNVIHDIRLLSYSLIMSAVKYAKRALTRGPFMS